MSKASCDETDIERLAQELSVIENITAVHKFLYHAKETSDIYKGA